MADYTHPSQGAPYGAYRAYDDQSQGSANTLGVLTNLAGGLVSLALIVGLGVWGYKLFQRDVSGIPVVRAAQGEMRIKPDDPGGQLARHQGLSVNAVAAEGAASDPADELRLAPAPTDLAEEDQPVTAAPVATVQQTAETEEAPAAVQVDADAIAALEDGNVDALVAQLTQGVAPLEEAAPAPATDPVLAAVAVAVAETPRPPAPAINKDAPVPVSLRPALRPERAPAAATDAVIAPVPSPADVDPSAIPAGTRLVQLGAFDSPEIARKQWDRLAVRFEDFLVGKQRVVQEAQSGGRTFYRLRAMGFDGIADARRFCSALVAEDADCIPVVAR